LAVLHGVVSIAPIRTFQPYPSVRCPKGYSLWWPAGKEFENDRFAQCVQPLQKEAKAHSRSPKITTNVSLKEKIR
jgi:hypothetical protein